MQTDAALMDAGKINELTKLLQSFGVQAVTQLKSTPTPRLETELYRVTLERLSQQ